MEQVANVSRWEWFKLRKRWMPWILLVLLLAFSQLSVWGGFFSYRNLKNTGPEVRFGIREQSRVVVSCTDLQAGIVPASLKGSDPALLQALSTQCDQANAGYQQRLQNMYRDLTPPGSVRNILQNAQVFIVILATILTASLIGAEYGLGTLRPVIASGTGRWQYLAGKLLLMLLAVAGALAILTVATFISSAVAKALEGTGPAGTPNVGWSSVWTALAKDWFALIPDISLTAFVTVLAGSTASGLAIGLGYYFVELILVAVLAPFSWFDNIANFMLGRAMSAWNGGGIFGSNNIAVPGNGQSILVLSLYAILLGGAAFYLFLSRDIKGAVGT